MAAPKARKRGAKVVPSIEFLSEGGGLDNFDCYTLCRWLVKLPVVAFFELDSAGFSLADLPTKECKNFDRNGFF